MGKDDIIAFLGAGTFFEGKLSFKGSVRIDGDFQGEVESDGTLVVGREAHLRGTVRVGQLVLSGKLTGEIIATEKITLHRQADLQGTVRTPVLVVEEGGVMEGDVLMSEPSAEQGRIESPASILPGE
ncbi:MAG: bactofilin family protein [Desulfovibrionales bacterium]